MEASVVITAGEREHTQRLPALSPPVERPIFVAGDDRRARWVRYGVAVVLLVSCLWLVALVIGMLGIAQLPGISLPSVVRGAENGSNERAPASVDSSTPASSGGAVKTTVVGPQGSVKTQTARPTPSARRTSHEPKRQPLRARDIPDAAPPAQGAQTPVAQQPAPAPAPASAAKQGWARQGYTAPPGQSRQTEPPAPTTVPGQSQRVDAGSTTAPAPATPGPATVPPGQQKKAEDPTPKG
jgi:hypothetical protein